jgi:hypothetical protein
MICYSDHSDRLGIGAIVNVQEPGEHPLCGDGNHRECGFSYLPEEFMDAGGRTLTQSCFHVPISLGWMGFECGSLATTD